MAIIEINGGPITHKYLMGKTKYELADMYMRLLRETARDAKDAERYRWLREHVTDRFVRNNEHEPCLLLPHNVDYLSPDEIDTAIDSAMQQGGGGGGG